LRGVIDLRLRLLLRLQHRSSLSFLIEFMLVVAFLEIPSSQRAFVLPQMLLQQVDFAKQLLTFVVFVTFEKAFASIEASSFTFA